MSLDEAKHLIYLIAQRDTCADKVARYPFMEEYKIAYDVSIIELHRFIMSLVRP